MASIESRVKELERRAGIGEQRVLVIDPAMTEEDVQAMVASDRQRNKYRGDYLLVCTGVPRRYDNR